MAAAHRRYDISDQTWKLLSPHRPKREVHEVKRRGTTGT